MRYHPIPSGETIFPGESVKETSELVNGKRVIKIDEKSFIYYKFDKSIWSREEATKYINETLKTLTVKEKIVKHSETFWTWKVEIEK